MNIAKFDFSNIFDFGQISIFSYSEMEDNL